MKSFYFLPSILSCSRSVLRVLWMFGLYTSVASAAVDDWGYTEDGLEWRGQGSDSFIRLGLRMQARYSNLEEEPVVLSDFHESLKSGSDINRARYKIWAGLKDDFTFYHEYDLRDSRLLDLRGTWVVNPKFKLRLGQWKPEFNRERVDSSGKQQFSERSISTYWFTIDRQWGVMASGRVGNNSAMDASWWAGILAGNGRSVESDGGRPMGLLRWQWNYTRTMLPFSQSGLERYAKPHGSLAFAVVANDSKFTRYSSDGGGQLPGYFEGDDNQYRTYQAMQEWAWQRGGLSFQQELHWKSVEDRHNGEKRTIVGGYAQAGWFPAERWQPISKNFELALRVAYVRPDDQAKSENGEFTLGANWFFNGHRNKLTFDTSYLTIDDRGASTSDARFRVQWDISL